jgi:hypothetical protein
MRNAARGEISFEQRVDVFTADLRILLAAALRKILSQQSLLLNDRSGASPGLDQRWPDSDTSFLA